MKGVPVDEFRKIIYRYVAERGEVDLRELDNYARQFMPDWVPPSVWLYVMSPYLEYVERDGKMYARPKREP
ncbi:MAG: hypothetical protein QXT27_01630 [Pyrobaculum sp.]